jgi:predicted GNAT family acetyltransferase
MAAVKRELSQEFALPTANTGAIMHSAPRYKLESRASLIARPLTAADAPDFARLCARDPCRMLTPRLNIEAHGFDGPVVHAWGAFAADGAEMVGLMLRFSNTVIPVDRDGECAAVFAPIIDTEPGLAGMRGTSELVADLQALLRRYQATDWEDSFHLRLLHPPHCAPETLTLARRARPEDLDRLAALYAEAGSMYRSRANVAAKLDTTRVFVAEEPATLRRPARIVSCALLNVEGHDAGLIGGVYTHPQARGRGYAAACTARLSLDLLNDGKMPCLFYENPVAGRVYRRLGFEDAGRWAVLYLTPVRER